MAINSMYSVNQTLRISGLASGLDTESIINDLMQIEQLKVDSLKQEKQLLEWKRDDYREITNLLRGFYDKYFDILYAETNMRSSNAYNTYVAESSKEEYVTVTSNADAIKRDYQITSVQVARAAMVESNEAITGSQGTGIDLDLTLEELNSKLTGGQGFQFEQITDEDGNVVVSEGVKFTINGNEFIFSKDDTLREIISNVNTSEAGVTLSYSSISDTFRLENKVTGADQELTFGDLDGTSFLSALKFETVQDGRDGILKIKINEGEEIEITRSTNVFTIDGITFNLKKDFTADDSDYININITKDVTQPYENIKGFVEEYNKLIDKINSELKEERFSDYPPLTEAQKEEMSEKEIELWEEKARSGMLRNDSVLQNIVYSMRRALVEGVEGISVGLSSIGITTGLYFEQGKLYIDESKLKEALETRPDQVMMLFSKESDIKYSPDLTSEQRTERYNESGLIHRIYDILQDNIRTIRDENGRKGILLEKAGIVGDTSEFDNTFYDMLNDMDERIDDAIDRMYEVEERYWTKFTAMETALQQMYSQSAWLSQQLGMGTAY